ncbi:MAG: DUF1080 domain-containing protein [Bacteroidota bacterium]
MKNSMLAYRQKFWFLFVLIVPLISCKPNQVDSEASAYIDLFNGKDLSGWYTYQRKPEPTSVVAGLRMEDGKYVEPIGLNNDPLDVFSVVELDGAQVIRISGEVFGILVTDEEYENYHLSLEFKWGEKKYPPREDQKRDSGICYHSFGEEGAQGGVWMKSVECQIQEGDVGDLWCVNATTAQVNVTNVGDGRFIYDPSGLAHTFDWREIRHCQRSTDFEKPKGEWNTVEIYAVGNESIHVVNGKKNMHLKDMQYFIDGQSTPLTKGKIQLQSEGAEVYYRNIRIRPIDKLPAL